MLENLRELHQLEADLAHELEREGYAEAAA